MDADIQILRRLANRAASGDLAAHFAAATGTIVDDLLPITFAATSPKLGTTLTSGAQLWLAGRFEESRPPALRDYIAHLIKTSEVGIISLLGACVYLARLKAGLKQKIYGHPSTPHRVFLAALILVVKYLYDRPLRNGNWVKYSRYRSTRTVMEFTREAVNRMERQLIFLLDWNLAVHAGELCAQLKVFPEIVRQETVETLVPSSTYIRPVPQAPLFRGSQYTPLVHEYVSPKQQLQQLTTSRHHLPSSASNHYGRSLSDTQRSPLTVTRSHVTPTISGRCGRHRLRDFRFAHSRSQLQEHGAASERRTATQIQLRP